MLVHQLRIRLGSVLPPTSPLRNMPQEPRDVIAPRPADIPVSDWNAGLQVLQRALPPTANEDETLPLVAQAIPMIQHGDSKYGMFDLQLPPVAYTPPATAMTFAQMAQSLADLLSLLQGIPDERERTSDSLKALQYQYNALHNDPADVALYHRFLKALQNADYSSGAMQSLLTIEDPADRSQVGNWLLEQLGKPTDGDGVPPPIVAASKEIEAARTGRQSGEAWLPYVRDLDAMRRDWMGSMQIAQQRAAFFTVGLCRPQGEPLQVSGERLRAFLQNAASDGLPLDTALDLYAFGWEHRQESGDLSHAVHEACLRDVPPSLLDGFMHRAVDGRKSHETLSQSASREADGYFLSGVIGGGPALQQKIAHALMAQDRSSTSYKVVINRLRERRLLGMDAAAALESVLRELRTGATPITREAETVSIDDVRLPVRQG